MTLPWTLAVRSRLWARLSWDFRAHASESVCAVNGTDGSMSEFLGHPRATSMKFCLLFSRLLALTPPAIFVLSCFPAAHASEAKSASKAWLVGEAGGPLSASLSAAGK